MNSVAKSTIIVPLVILFIALVMRFSQATYSLNSKTIIRPTSILFTPSPVLSGGFNVNSLAEVQSLFNPQFLSSSSLDLKGPYACSIVDNDIDAKIFIKDRNIYIKYKQMENTSFILIKNDCAYRWMNQERQGIKVCNIEQYISIIESMSKMPFFSPEMLFSMVTELDGSSNKSIGADDVKQLLKTCEEREVDDSLFIIPTQVTFIEQKISSFPQEKLEF